MQHKASVETEAEYGAANTQCKNAFGTSIAETKVSFGFMVRKCYLQDCRNAIPFHLGPSRFSGSLPPRGAAFRVLGNIARRQ